MLRTVCESIAAGFLIAIGGCVFLACENRTVGAILFSVALLCICYMGYYLYTGRIGYLTEDLSGRNAVTLTAGLTGNLVTTFLLGLLIRAFLPALGETAAEICRIKLSQTFPETLIRAFFCGILMYLAVQIFREKNTPVGILFCIPVFILSGFEHSVADMFYFGASGILKKELLLFEVAAVLGNTLGSLLLPTLTKVGHAHARKAE